MFEKFVLWYELYKTDIVYTIGYRLNSLFNFEFGWFNIYLVVFIHRFNFERSEGFIVTEFTISWIKISNQIVYKVNFICVCLKIYKGKRLKKVKAFIIGMHCINLGILTSFFINLSKFILIYSIDTFIFIICILSVKVEWKTNFVCFIIISLERL